MKRVLVLGATGMLGHKVAQALSDLDVTATVRAGSAATPYLEPSRIVTDVDVTNLDRVADVVAEAAPEVIVNCIGVIKQLPAAHDPIPSITLNSLLPHHLAALAGKHDARLIHFSTDCVFSGTKGSYTEDDLADPVDLYGRSKLLGEVHAPRALTLRTSIIGRELRGSTSLVEWFLSNAGGSVDGYSNAVYSGVTTLEMARLVRRLIDTAPELSGLYHVASDPIDKYRLLCLLRDAFGIDVEITPVDQPRLDRSLVADRFEDAVGWKAPSWEQMVDEMAADPNDYDDWRP